MARPRIVLSYRLTPEGQRAAALVGVDAAREQQLEIHPHHPLWAQAAAIADLDEAGVGRIRIGRGHRGDPAFPHLYTPTVDLAWTPDGAPTGPDHVDLTYNEPTNTGQLLVDELDLRDRQEQEREELDAEHRAAVEAFAVLLPAIEAALDALPAAILASGVNRPFQVIGSEAGPIKVLTAVVADGRFADPARQPARRSRPGMGPLEDFTPVSLYTPTVEIGGRAAPNVARLRERLEELPAEAAELQVELDDARAAAEQLLGQLPADTEWPAEAHTLREVLDNPDTPPHAVESATAEARKPVEQAVEFAVTIEWVRAHGSERLRRILDDGYLPNSVAVYRDERLAVERPGWRWNAATPGKVAGDPRNPTVEAFEVLDQALAVDPAAKLRYWAVPNAWSGCVAVAQFLGKPIVYGYQGPDEAPPAPPARRRSRDR
jgi:hypothetical protein